MNPIFKALLKFCTTKNLFKLSLIAHVKYRYCENHEHQIRESTNKW